MKIRDPHNHALTMLTLLLLAGCNQAPQGDQMAGIAAGSERPDKSTASAQAQPNSCLLLVWDAAGSTDVAFDRANDAVAGGTISCAAGTTPTRFSQTMETMRAAAGARDIGALTQALADDVLLIGTDGERTQITVETPSPDRAALFTPDVIEALSEMTLADLTVAPGQGAFLALGGIWFGVAETGGAPQIRTINRQALVEAKAASAE